LAFDKLNPYNQRFESHFPVYSSAGTGSTPGYAGEYETRFKIQPGQFYHWFVLDLYSSNHREQHSYAHSWYTQTVSSSKPGGGFAYSPFINTSPFPTGAGAASQATTSTASVGAATKNATALPHAQVATSSSPVSGFSTFGQVSELAGTYTLTEQNNSGIYLDVTLPAEVSMLVVSYHWLSMGDGDFLSVHWNDEPPLAVIPAVAMDGGAPIQAEVPLEAFAGKTGRLTIKLVSRTNPNAIVNLSGLSFQISADPDGDGLSAAEEATRGTDPMKADTDGDGLNDDYEVQTSLTSPLSEDTDGDGKSDSSELFAGTNALSSLSRLDVSSVSLQSGRRFALGWPSVAGKSYRVRRGPSPSRENYLTIGTGILGVGSQATFIDTPPVDAPAMFYWIEVEPF
jgi:hypothetical protein